jgi:hypothetical protein
MRKTKLKEVKTSFIYSRGYKYLLGLGFYYHFGIHQKGVWIGQFRNEQNFHPLGFLQWDWIKKILIDSNTRSVYFIMHDVNAVLKTIVPAIVRPFVKMQYLMTADDGEKSLCVPSIINWDDIGLKEYFEIEKFVNIVKENNFAQIEFID